MAPPALSRARALSHLAGALLVVILSVPGGMAGAAAGGLEPVEDGATPTTQPGLVGGDVIPRPDSGREPAHPGDRGGWQQTLLFGLIVAAIAIGVLLVVRESRRKSSASS